MAKATAIYSTISIGWYKSTWVVSIEVQILGDITNCKGSKQKEVTFEGKDKEFNFDWNTWIQETEVSKLGKWKREVSQNLMDKLPST